MFARSPYRGDGSLLYHRVHVYLYIPSMILYWRLLHLRAFNCISPSSTTVIQFHVMYSLKRLITLGMPIKGSFERET
jgi:hypothetical protein